MPLPTRMVHAGMQLFKESGGEYTKSKNPLDEILLLYWNAKMIKYINIHENCKSGENFPW